MRRYSHPRGERSFVQAGQTLGAEYLDERISESSVQGTFAGRVYFCVCVRLKYTLKYL